MNHTITANELEHGSAGRLTALTLAIGGMWPDGHEAMRASDGSIQLEFRPGTGNVRWARWAQQRQSSPHAISAPRAVADMWPDEHEAMLALARQIRAEIVANEQLLAEKPTQCRSVDAKHGANLVDIRFFAGETKLLHSLTSIDAMAVGVGLAFLSVNIVPIAIAIGMTTFVAVTLGVMLGRELGRIVGKRAELLGGLVLIAIGAMILAEHLSGAA